MTSLFTRITNTFSTWLPGKKTPAPVVEKPKEVSPVQQCMADAFVLAQKAERRSPGWAPSNREARLDLLEEKLVLMEAACDAEDFAKARRVGREISADIAR